MPSIAISSLPTFDENKLNSWLIINNSGETETFKIRRENLFDAKPYLNVAEMVSDPNLTLNDYAQTLGYYTPNDGGEMVYIIQNSGTVDGGSVIVLNNGLYAIAQLPDVVSPIMWGGRAQNNSTSAATYNVTAATNMFDFISREQTTLNSARRNGRKVRFPQNSYYINNTVYLPWGYIENVTYDIDLNGCKIVGLSASTDYPMFARLKTYMDIKRTGSIVVDDGSIYMGARILIYNGSFYGPNYNDNTIGIQIQCTYSSEIKNIYFQNLGVGLSCQFCLNTNIHSNLHNTQNYGTYLSSGFGFWDGASRSNSQCNVSTITKDRYYCTYPSKAAIYIGESSGVAVLDTIIEGGETVYGIHFNANDSTVVKDFTVERLHLEVAQSTNSTGIQGVTGAGIFLDKKAGGFTKISDIFYQYSYSTFNSSKNSWTGITNGTEGTYVLNQSDGDFTTNGSGTNLSITFNVNSSGQISSWSLSGSPLASSGYTSGDLITIPSGALGASSTQATIMVSRRDIDENGSIKAGNPLIDTSTSYAFTSIDLSVLYWVGGTKIKSSISEQGSYWTFRGAFPLDVVKLGTGLSNTELSVDNVYWVAWKNSSGQISREQYYRIYSEPGAGTNGFGNLGITAKSSAVHLGRVHIQPNNDNDILALYTPNFLRHKFPIYYGIFNDYDLQSNNLSFKTGSDMLFTMTGSTGDFDIRPGSNGDVKLFNNSYRLPRLSGKTNTTIINNGTGTTTFGYLPGQVIKESILTSSTATLQQLTTSFTLITGASITWTATSTSQYFKAKFQITNTSSNNIIIGLSNSTSSYSSWGVNQEQLVGINSGMFLYEPTWYLTGLTIGQEYTINLGGKFSGGGQSYFSFGGNTSGKYSDVYMTIIQPS